MTTAVALLGALGLVLLASGVPKRHPDRLRRRVEPYLALATADRAGSEALLRRLGGWLEGWGLASEQQLRERLEAAGLRPHPGSFRIGQLAWGAAAMVGGWLCVAGAAGAGVSMDPPAVLILSALLFALGYAARDRWLAKRIEERRATFQEELPTALDLLTLSIMAGESVPAALDRVASTLGPGIGEELARVVADMRAGLPVTEALERLKERVPVAGAARFVDALLAGIEHGAPLADALRSQAEDGREARRRYLMESGGRREVLMLVPVVFLILPTVVVFVLYPAVVALDLLVP
jgi:tight adherence protein C